jgi:hypothetical protein
VYCAVADFVGSAGFTISSAGVPYAYSALDISVQFSSSNVMIYSFTVAL